MKAPFKDVSDQDRQALGMYRGVVTSNADPKQLGRIQVRVFPFFNEVDAKALPWAVPAMPLWAGAGGGTGSFCVPEIGSYVFVFFEMGNYYQPVYFAEAQDGVHGLPAERTADYPATRVMKLPSGVVLTVDGKTDNVSMKALHPTGSYFQIDPLGNVSVFSVQDLTLQAMRDVLISSGRDTLVSAGRNLFLTALLNLIELITGSKAVNIGLSKVETVTFAINQTVGTNINSAAGGVRCETPHNSC